MFGFGLMEIGLLVIVAVVLFPPHELPKLARSAARFYGTIRRVADDFRSTVLEDADIGEPIREIRTAYQQTRWQLRQAEQAARQDISRAQAGVRAVVQPTSDPGIAAPQGTVASLDGPAEDTPASVEKTTSNPATPATSLQVSGESVAGSAAAAAAVPRVGLGSTDEKAAIADKSDSASGHGAA